ncbi:hypothetical protein THAOC_34468 [Thalassiosira oceanica]|uniref:Uncharacterized protein n=1 Tax=Thalassiosira oceanica TaxID=159749 RepID=K0RCP4_THAOC|nr:hypothetical protein THAOC_34468 [Thalassiosira oceanica]|eukprot:EJK46846.1 hypothetical protein THAOC_34468 [Thalassiosira oceanica]
MDSRVEILRDCHQKYLSSVLSSENLELSLTLSISSDIQGQRRPAAKQHGLEAMSTLPSSPRPSTGGDGQAMSTLTLHPSIHQQRSKRLLSLTSIKTHTGGCSLDEGLLLYDIFSPIHLLGICIKGAAFSSELSDIIWFGHHSAVVSHNKLGKWMHLVAHYPIDTTLDLCHPFWDL